MTTQTEVEITNNLIAEADTSVPAHVDPLANSQNFELIQRYAKVYAASSLLPERFRGKVADCIIGVEMSRMLGIWPLYLFKNLYITSGTPSIQGELATALVNARGGLTSKLDFEYEGKEGEDSYSCVAYGIEAKTGKKLLGPKVSIAIAKAEGWYQRNPKWKNLPQLMLQYRAASWFARKYCPEVLGGLQTIEEVEDVIDVTPGGGAAKLNAKIKGETK